MPLPAVHATGAPRQRTASNDAKRLTDVKADSPLSGAPMVPRISIPSSMLPVAGGLSAGGAACPNLNAWVDGAEPCPFRPVSDGLAAFTPSVSAVQPSWLAPALTEGPERGWTANLY